MPAYCVCIVSARIPNEPNTDLLVSAYLIGSVRQSAESAGKP